MQLVLHARSGQPLAKLLVQALAPLLSLLLHLAAAGARHADDLCRQRGSGVRAETWRWLALAGAGWCWLVLAGAGWRWLVLAGAGWQLTMGVWHEQSGCGCVM
jgi:hypothetical protein